MTATSINERGTSTNEDRRRRRAYRKLAKDIQLCFDEEEGLARIAFSSAALHAAERCLCLLTFPFSLNLAPQCWH